LADHLEVYLGEYVPLTAKDVQLENYRIWSRIEFGTSDVQLENYRISVGIEFGYFRFTNTICYIRLLHNRMEH
jgi:hypothetical protein